MKQLKTKGAAALARIFALAIVFLPARLSNAAAGCPDDFQNKTAKDLNECVKSLQDQITQLSAPAKGSANAIVSAGIVAGDENKNQPPVQLWSGSKVTVNAERTFEKGQYKLTFNPSLNKSPFVLSGPALPATGLPPTNFSTLVVDVNQSNFTIQVYDRTSVEWGPFWFAVLAP